MYICHFPFANWIFHKIMIYIISVPSFINAPLLVIEIIGWAFLYHPRHAGDTKYPGSDRVKKYYMQYFVYSILPMNPLFLI